MKRFWAFLLAAAAILQIMTGCAASPAVPDGTSVATHTATQPVTEPTKAITAADVRINEVMADNQKLCMGHTMDWVELYNGSAEPVSLEGYFLTNDPKKPEALSLAGLRIDAGEYLAVVLDNQAPFHLSAVGGAVYLTFQSEVISQLTFANTTFGESFDQNGACDYPSPGFANTEEGYLAYLEQQTLPELIITEVLPKNRSVAIGGGCYDFVELKNNSDQPIDLSFYALTDRWEKPSRFYLPDVILQPGQYYVVFCSGDPSLGENHAPFQISSKGETLYLTKGGEYLDSITVPGDLKPDESYGRSGNIPLYLQKPTPGAENTAGWRHGIAVPQPDIAPGVYAQPVTVSLSGEGTIYYTLDGSRPTTKSKTYQQPLVLDGVTTIRCFCVSDGRTSGLTAYSYAVGADAHLLPVVTVSIPEKYLTGPKGIFTLIHSDVEYEGVLTYFENGQAEFCLPFGFCLHGVDSRNGDKKNFQIHFRSEYGASKLNYPLFESRDYTEFNSLLLKGGSEDWARAVMRDELCTTLTDGTTNLYVQAMKPVVLYIGGKYWGVYYLRERFSDDYVASRLGGSSDAVDLLRGSGASAQAGSNREFLALRAYVQSHDMSKAENYRYLTEQIDVYSLMDWYICRSYLGDKDIGNIRRFRSTDADGKWKWMFYDLDWAFCHTTDKPLTSIAKRGGVAEYALIQAVLASEQGRDAFLRRYAYLMDTVLNEKSINAAIDNIVSAISPEMPRDRARWNCSMAGWEASVQDLRDYVNDHRRDRQVLQDLKAYFHLTDQEMREYFGE